MTRSNQEQPGNAAAPTPRPLSPQWSAEATPLSGNYVTILWAVTQKPDVPPKSPVEDPGPKRFTFNSELIQAQVHKPSFCTLHEIPAAGEETKPAHPQQEAPVTAASGAALKIDIPLSRYPKVSQHPAQHVSAAIGERSVQIAATMDKFVADKFPSPEPENDGNFRP